MIVMGAAASGCSKPPASEAQLLVKAKKHIAKPSVARDLFETAASDEQWQEAFKANGRDAELHEAYVYRELLNGRADGNVEGAVARVRELVTADPWVWYLTAKRAWVDSVTTAATEETALRENAQVATSGFDRAQELEPDNAFYQYQEGAFLVFAGDNGGALRAFKLGNDAKVYQHPFGAPLPRKITSLREDLIETMGDHLYVYFRTNPRMFLGDVNNNLKSLAALMPKDEAAMATILRTGARQLEMEPFDPSSFQGAIGLNKSLWQQYAQTGHESEAKPVLDALNAFDKPFSEFAASTDQLIRRLKIGGPEGQVTYGVAALMMTMDQEATLAPLREKLRGAIKAALPAEGTGVTEG